MFRLFICTGKIDLSVSTYMRRLVADKIASQPEEYSDAILGKPSKEYCSWILNPNSWGGAIELAILSDHYGFEIAVVNSTTGVVSRFGEDKRYDHRVFLLFDGIHYDPLYMDFIEVVFSKVVRLISESKSFIFPFCCRLIIFKQFFLPLMKRYSAKLNSWQLRLKKADNLQMLINLWSAVRFVTLFWLVRQKRKSMPNKLVTPNLTKFPNNSQNSSNCR